MAPMRVLIVDDDAALAANLATGLGRAGMAATVITNPARSDLAGAARAADAVILDVMLGAADGLEVSQQLRRGGVDTPILMLTARESVADRVRGLEAGADDYLIKPFALEELVARLRALVRRKVSERTAVLEAGGLRFDTRTGSAEVAGQALRLTQRESMFLERLLLNLGHPVSQQQLLEQLWHGEASPSSNIAEVYVSRLRKKLGDAGARLTIVTLKRLGYQLERAAEAPEVAGAPA
jgi:DNA-binding response OmpR family regulator